MRQVHRFTKDSLIHALLVLGGLFGVLAIRYAIFLPQYL